MSFPCSGSPFSSSFICDDLRPLYSCWPTHDHAAQRIPSVSENQNQMRHDEEDIDPHQPEMPDACCVVPSKERCQPMELHGLVNRPACSDRKEPGDRKREVCCALERVLLCVEGKMQPFAACQFSEGKPQVVSKHLERVQQIGPARQQGAPASSQDQPRNVHHAIQH